MAIIQPPPNSTGDAEQDIQALSQWIWAFYSTILGGGGFTSVDEANALQQVLEGEITEQVDPANATAATAQATANANKAVLDAQDAGQFTITNPDLTAVVTLTNEQEDTNYYVATNPVGESVSTVVEGRYIIKKIDKTTTQFTATIHTNLLAGQTITFDWILLRKD